MQSVKKDKLLGKNRAKTVYDMYSCCRHLNWLHPNTGLLPGDCLEFTGSTESVTFQHSNYEFNQ